MCHDENPKKQGKVGREISDQCWMIHEFPFSSPDFDRDDEESGICHPPDALSPTMEDE